MNSPRHSLREMRGLVRKFVKLPFREKSLFIEALFFLTEGCIIFLFIPFRKIAPLLGVHKCETSNVLAQHHSITLAGIDRAIKRANHFLPWKNKCIHQAFTAKIMLKRRRIPSTLYFGVAKPDRRLGNLKAHAWVRCGKWIINDGHPDHTFTTLGIFGDPSDSNSTENKVKKTI